MCGRGGAARGRRAGRHHAAADRLLPRRLHPRRTASRRARARACTPTRSCCERGTAQGRAGGRRGVRDPGRAAGGRRAQGRGARASTARTCCCRPRTRTRGRAATSRTRPTTSRRRACRPRPTRSASPRCSIPRRRRPALHVHGRPHRRVDPPRERRPRARRRRLGPHDAARRHAEPLDRGAPRRPRHQRADRARAGGDGPATAPATRSTPTSTCCASTRSRRGGGSRSARGRTSPITGRSMHSELRAYYAATTTPRRGASFSKLRAPPRHTSRAPDGRQRLRQRRRGRPDRRASRTSARRPRTGSGPRRRWRCCAPGGAAGRASRAARPRSTCAGRGRASAGATRRPARSTRQGREGLGFLTGSEEERGPLYDITQVPSRAARPGRRSGAGRQVGRSPARATPPPAVPIARLPRRRPCSPRFRARRPRRRARGSSRRSSAAMAPERRAARGDRRASRTTTSSTSPRARSTASRATRAHRRCTARTRGRSSSSGSVDLGKRLADGRPAPDPYALDPATASSPTAPVPGRRRSRHGAVTATPQVERLGHPSFSWQGAPSGHVAEAATVPISARGIERCGSWLSSPIEAAASIPRTAGCRASPRHRRPLQKTTRMKSWIHSHPVARSQASRTEPRRV